MKSSKCSSMLMRTEVKEKKDLEERQLVAEAAIQAKGALRRKKQYAKSTILHGFSFL